MAYDHWLDRWLALLAERVAGGPVLEIGCGDGEDTAVLTANGFEVVAFDRSVRAIAKAKTRAPQARFECQDLRAPFPLGGRHVGAIVASLSLHYLPWSDTVAVVERIRTTLWPGGVLLCRVNSVDDRNYGAGGHLEIEPSYYLVDGRPKRFFDRHSLEELFSAGWRCLSLEQATTRKYGLPKALWEAIVERDLEPQIEERGEGTP